MQLGGWLSCLEHLNGQMVAGPLVCGEPGDRYPLSLVELHHRLKKKKKQKQTNKRTKTTPKERKEQTNRNGSLGPSAWSSRVSARACWFGVITLLPVDIASFDLQLVSQCGSTSDCHMGPTPKTHFACGWDGKQPGEEQTNAGREETVSLSLSLSQ